jgi:SAM-dependent methyltransferase
MTRRDAPATHRNREPILEVLARWLTEPARVLEVASGTGQHSVYFSTRLPHVTWQPSDADAGALSSIESWVAEEGPSNLLAPIELDASATIWPESVERTDFDAIFNANMIHIAPWRVAEGLLSGAGRRLREGGLLFLYGPFRIGGLDTALSNAAFDVDLRKRNSEWGVRDLETVERVARESSLEIVETNDMPANNKLIVFARRASEASGTPYAPNA